MVKCGESCGDLTEDRNFQEDCPVLLSHICILMCLSIGSVKMSGDSQL